MLLHFLKRLPIKRFGFPVTKLIVIPSQSDMSTLAIPIASTPDDWLEQVDKAIQRITVAAQKARATIVRERAVVRFYFALRELNNQFMPLELLLHNATIALQSGELTGIEEHGDEPNAQEVLAKMNAAYRLLHAIYELAKIVGFKKKLLTRYEVRRLGDFCEVLLDYTTWLGEAISPEALAHAESSYAEGLRELEAGETVAFV